MKRFIALLSLSFVVALGAFAQKDVTAEQLLEKYYKEHGTSRSRKSSCPHSDCKKSTCRENSSEADDEYLPICRDEAEELITKMIVEARAPYVKQREEDRMLQRFKIETLKRRLLDQALRNTYVDEYKDRLDRMERLLMTLILANSGKADPAIVSALMGGQGIPNANTIVTPGAKADQSLAPAQLTDNTTIVAGETAENFLSQVFFALAKADLTPQSKETLDGVVAWLKENSTIKMSLRGYASPEGKLDFNNRLSGRRVNAVADYLVSKGISRSRLQIIPSGIDSITSAWPEARRVDIRPVLCE